jgi:hypothetical protein
MSVVTKKFAIAVGHPARHTPPNIPFLNLRAKVMLGSSHETMNQVNCAHSIASHI